MTIKTTINGTVTIDTARGFDVLGAKGQVIEHFTTLAAAQNAVKGTKRVVRYWTVMPEGEGA